MIIIASATPTTRSIRCIATWWWEPDPADSTPARTADRSPAGFDPPGRSRSRCSSPNRPGRSSSRFPTWETPTPDPPHQSHHRSSHRSHPTRCRRHSAPRCRPRHWFPLRHPYPRCRQFRPRRLRPRSRPRRSCPFQQSRWCRPRHQYPRCPPPRRFHPSHRSRLPLHRLRRHRPRRPHPRHPRPAHPPSSQARET